ncbi:MAG: hypothetical protein A2V70_07790 [Planctomycetes bacterium RBG_13_63_9]|nr:MAG: hypothetical protein A2V70_07790 [Planctomycetes bacterium RBG_13_63_9]
MARRWHIKRILLYSFIGALVVCAVLGIYAFLFGRFGETEIRILATTSGVCFYSLIAMACFAALEKRRSKVLALPGLGTCAAGMLVLLGVIWLDHHFEEGTLKLAAILAMFSFSFAQASLLSLARLERKLAWVSWIAYGAIFWLVIQLSVMIVWEIDDEWLIRVAGVLGILDGCASLAIPVLYKLHGGPKPVATRQTYTHITLTFPIPGKVGEGPKPEGSRPSYAHFRLACPRCGHQDNFAVGAVECPECSLKMRVEVQATSEAVENPPFQFDLRSLMIVTLIVAVALSIFATRIQELRVQQRITTQFREIGANARWEKGKLVSVAYNRCTGASIPDEDLLLLKESPDLEQLSFNNVPITDRQMALLEGLSVRVLSLAGTRVTAAGLGHLSGLPKLESLTLVETQITDEGLRQLESLSNLRRMNLTYGPHVSSAGIERLRRALPRTGITARIATPPQPLKQ